MIRGPKRHAQSQQIAISTPEAMRGLEDIEDSFVIPLGDDGMAARLLRMPPHHSLEVEHPPGCQGQFIFVLAGAVALAGREIARWEQLYATHDEPIASLTASAAGAQLLCLSVPRQADPYR
jgi:redox-sensitive bicupin YhaK (pirin superfamily)